MSCINPAEIKFIQRRARSRQVTMNRRFKDWGIFKEVFRHHIPKHAEVMYDVAVITQISIDNGEIFFHVNYCNV